MSQRPSPDPVVGDPASVDATDAVVGFDAWQAAPLWRITYKGASNNAAFGVARSVLRRIAASTGLSPRLPGCSRLAEAYFFKSGRAHLRVALVSAPPCAPTVPAGECCRLGS